MADRSRVNRTNMFSPLSHADLREEPDWEWIARCLKTHGVNSDTLAWIGPKLWRLLYWREQQLPATHRLPPPIQGVLHLALTARTFKKPRLRPSVDHTALAQYMQTFVENQGLTVIQAAWKAVDKFGCTHGSAMTWYYQWHKHHPQ